MPGKRFDLIQTNTFIIEPRQSKASKSKGRENIRSVSNVNTNHLDRRPVLDRVIDANLNEERSREQNRSKNFKPKKFGGAQDYDNHTGSLMYSRTSFLEATKTVGNRYNEASHAEIGKWMKNQGSAGKEQRALGLRPVTATLRHSSLFGLPDCDPEWTLRHQRSRMHKFRTQKTYAQLEERNNWKSATVESFTPADICLSYPEEKLRANSGDRCRTRRGLQRNGSFPCQENYYFTPMEANREWANCCGHCSCGNPASAFHPRAHHYQLCGARKTSENDLCDFNKSDTNIYYAAKMSKAVIGKSAPDFTTTAVVNGEFKTVKLSDFAGKYLVLFFYPLDFTFVCPTEIIAFGDRAEEFRKIGCEVVAASTDSEFSHFAWINTPRKQGGLGDMKIPMLADTNHQISRDYGVLIEDKGIALRYGTQVFLRRFRFEFGRNVQIPESRYIERLQTNAVQHGTIVSIYKVVGSKKRTVRSMENLDRVKKEIEQNPSVSTKATVSYLTPQPINCCEDPKG